ncbi:MAG: sensor histidine kinase [Bryobacterales bacterium]|nr:sensor histidine kinase [Bryobacterales bacterium]
MALTLSSQVTHRTILGVLIGGFALVILLLLAAAYAGVANVQSIRAGAGAMVSEQLVTTRLIDEIQREQGALSAVFHRLARQPGTIDRERALSQLDQADQAIRRTVAVAAGRPDEDLWRELELAGSRFSSAARAMIGGSGVPQGASGELVELHQAVIAVVAKLVAGSYRRAAAAESRIDEDSRSLVRQSFILLGTCLLLALACAVLTVWTTTGLLRRMEWQAGELSRVSWHLLEKQETAARRFSHELHDELGQSLTALKANLVALPPGSPEARERKQDSLRLLEDAIRNVRELSQLLRPTMLDDFGLDAGLRWLADGFAARTGIHVDYTSTFSGRLPDEVETHLFRIAQEALTNVARHAAAGQVRMRLDSDGNRIRLLVADNGRGLPPAPGKPLGGLGMVGMRARARSAGGELSVRPAAGGGVEIEATIPSLMGAAS